MSAMIVGISGSPITNSNTDRLVKRVLEASGLPSEFVKLPERHVRPCVGCKRCVHDNICKVADDFPPLAETIKSARAVVLGGYSPYGTLDAFTKALLERLWSMRHLRGCNEGKIYASAVSSLNQEAAESANAVIGHFMEVEKARYVAQLVIAGNLPCLTCGVGNSCKNGVGVRLLHGPEAVASAELCVTVESQPVWDEAYSVGRMIGLHVNGALAKLPLIRPHSRHV